MIYGLHIKGDLIKQIKDEYNKNKIKCIQIFVYNIFTYKKIKMEYDIIKKYCELNKINIYIHANYITNSIWSLYKISKNKQKLLFLLSEQLKIGDKLNCKGLVIHIPKERIENIIKVLKIIKVVLKKYKTKILLENPSVRSKKFYTYEDPINFNILCYNIDKLKINWGLCLDTAHLWNSGIDIANKKILIEWLNKFEYKNKIYLIHLNGSFYNNSAKDKHAIPESKEDKIWGKNNTTLKIILNIGKKKKISIILEINRGSENDKKKILNKLKNM